MYTLRMAKKRDEARTETLSVKVPPEFKDELDRVAEANDRTLSQTSYMLIQRGLEFYKKDGLLMNPQVSDVIAGQFYPVLNIRDASDISGELGIDVNIVSDVVAGLTDGKDPQMVKAILDASKKQTDKVTPINSKLASG
jgi:hypothetical protein